MVRIDLVVSWTALAVAVLALILSIVAMNDDGRQVNSLEVADEVYDRILSEMWNEMRPVYTNFDIEMPQRPASFEELVGPLLSINSPLDSEAGIEPGIPD